MAARPVLDLRVGVRDLEEAKGAFDEALAGHGFARALPAGPGSRGQ
ncbi:GrpB family protein [Streptomyces noursei]